MSKYESHYEYLDANLKAFVDELPLTQGRREMVAGSSCAHGDKCYGYKRQWELAGVPFERGVAIYLLSYATPYAQEVRETQDGWVNVCDWVIQKYNSGMKEILESIEIC